MSSSRVARLLASCLALSPLVAAAEERAELDPPRLAREDVFELEYASDPQLSPDGRQLVYVRRSNDIMADRTASSLWLVPLDGGAQRPLVTDGPGGSSPRWSPDGTRLAYMRAVDGQAQIHVRWMDTGATSAVTRVAETPRALAWSPDGTQLAFVMAVPADGPSLVKAPSKPEGAQWAEPAKVIDAVRYRRDGSGFVEAAYDHVFVVPAEGGTPRQLTEGDVHHGGPLTWTPDGSHVLVSANRDPDWARQTLEADIYRVAVDGSGLEALVAGDGEQSSAAYSPDGARLAWLHTDNLPIPYVNTRLVVAGADGREPVTLLTDLDRDIAAFQWAGAESLLVQYVDRGLTVLDRVDLAGGHARLSQELGGMSLGRPYASGTFDVSPVTGAVVITRGTSWRPADLALLEDGAARPLTALNEDLLGARSLGEVHAFTYTSSFDGLEIDGWYVLPPDFDPDAQHPLVLEIHGGPHLAYGPHFAAELQLLAAAGYVVVYDNHRGSAGYGSDFAMKLYGKYSSPEDAADHLSAVDALLARGFIDERNLFVAGGSAGGIATAYLVGLTDRFNAAVAAKPVINWVSKTLTADSYIYQIRHQFPGPPWEHLEHYWRRSPLSLVGNVVTPTMILTGEQDWRTPMSESEQFYQALQLREVDTVLVRLPGSGHGIAGRPSRLIAKVDHILAWFERYAVGDDDTDAAEDTDGEDG